ncbi:MAG: hypothetical protein MI922_20495, partial [Bacteroidales bacterium]|nr:hypothetical protein [Bacteroidales bacterium]
MKTLIVNILVILCVSLNAQQDELKKFESKYKNGQIQSEGFLKNGKPEGYWKTYYPNGKLKSEGLRENFALSGTWIFYNFEGDVTEKIEYLNGKRNGYTYSYSKKDNNEVSALTGKELYVNNKKQGVSEYFYENGKIKEKAEYKNNKKNGYSYGYAEDGRIVYVTRFVDDNVVERDIINRYDSKRLKKGVWRSYYGNFKIRDEMSYKNGLLHGLYKRYDQRGQLISSVMYKDGKVVVNAEESTEEIIVKEEKDRNGNVKKRGSYIKNKPVGIHTIFNVEGGIEKSIIYSLYGKKESEGIIDKEGKRQGEWINYFESGKIASRGKYVNSLRHGDWNFYFENGKTEQKGKYNKGRKTGIWYWY